MRKPAIALLLLFILVLETYEIGICLIGVAIFKKATTAEESFLMAPLLSLPILLVSVKYPKAGVVLYWIFAATYHAVLASISWPDLLSVFFSVKVDWPLFAIGVILYELRRLRFKVWNEAE